MKSAIQVSDKITMSENEYLENAQCLTNIIAHKNNAVLTLIMSMSETYFLVQVLILR